MKSAKILHEKIASGSEVTGLLYTFDISLELVEVAMGSGCDYIIIDGEHLDHGHVQVADACRLCRLSDFPVLYRPFHTATHFIRAAMDLGACGLLLPSVETLKQLDDIRQGVYMPPRGRRRPGGPSNRWVSRHDYETFKSEVEDHLIMIPQIESRLGLENADAIAADEMVTALGIGPFDLSAELGICFDPDHPQLIDAWKRILSAASRVGKPMWGIGSPARLRELGVTFMCVGEPIEILKRSVRGLVEEAGGSG